MRAPVLEIRPLAPFGAEVRGLDLRQAQPVETQAILRAALTEHALLFLRDQDLARDDLFRFATMFGNISDQGEAAGGYNYVSNVNAPGINAAGEVTLTTGNGELEFHLDHCFQESPLKAIVLHAIEVPNEGGDTLFTDMRAITRRLPPALVAQLKGRTIRHRSPTRTGNPEATHPVMLEHPVSGVPVVLQQDARHGDPRALQRGERRAHQGAAHVHRPSGDDLASHVAAERSRHLGQPRAAARAHQLRPGRAAALATRSDRILIP